ncbi:MAG TPA: hypothetical protein VFV67_15905 [Actinophytocola sp.]|uniref:hypothetical protein n=1 Tax=Actinophytocola sp. TaxID=1872138 RepID=UPI002DB864F3|nr:hypothetical protein [Actinophytocola sp.]HEU5472137.1 hypothetical protein [Actinophytocola sp.]
MPARNDRYVTGDTNWETYDLEQLVAMVTQQVDLRGLMGLADDWRWTGNGLVDAAHELGAALDGLMEFWSGASARQARTDVALNAQWLADLGATAYEIGSPVEEAAGALKAAQDQMPVVPDVDPSIAPGSAPDGAAVGQLAGGPLGAAIGATAAGTQSAAEAALAEADLKRQAVEAMRRFETAAIGIDAAIPQFEGPDNVLRPPSEPPRRGRGEPPVTIIVDPGPGRDWDDLTGRDDSGTGAARHEGGSGGRGLDRGITVGAGGGSVGGLGPTFAPGGGFGIGGGGAGVGGRGAGGSPGTGAVPTPERLAGTVPAMSAGALADPDGRHGPAGGTPMAPMGGAAGAGGTAGDHRRRFPVDADDPFGLEKKASPPVIGL